MWISSARVVIGIALLAASGACNNLFGLDSAIPDRDFDGIEDAVDNCPLDENSQQRDFDGNGRGDVCDCTTSGVDADNDGTDDACDDCIGEPIGADAGNDGIDDGCQTCAAATGADVDDDGVDDACDPCTLGPSHDEDRDGVADACDICPTQADPNQSPAACERGVSGERRFDPLVEQDPTLWPGVVPGWEWTDDTLVATGVTTRGSLTAITAAYLVETRASTTETVALQCASTSSRASCMFEESTRTLVVSLEMGLGGGGNPPPPREARSLPLSPTGTVRFQLRVEPIEPTTSCEALDEAGNVIAVAKLADLAPCQRIKVASRGTSRLEYLWIVGDSSD